MNTIAPIDTLRRRSGDAIVYGGVRYRVSAESERYGRKTQTVT